MPQLPDFSLEEQFGTPAIGVDEVGRGPLAGPVVAAAVCFARNTNLPEGINDSKKLSEKKREYLFHKIYECAEVGIASIEVETIDRINILNASKLAMQQAVAQISITPRIILVDGNQPPVFVHPSRAIIKGDSKSISIAAASIIAKVTRDNLMKQLAVEHPAYGWESNAGYGTAAHLAAIKAQGITRHHRTSFAPIRFALTAKEA